MNIGNDLISNSQTKNILKPKITKSICFDNFIACGYDDGLILIWSQKTIKIDPENNEINEEKSYQNIFSLDFIFTGHTQAILEIFYLKSKNFLITSSQDGSVKIFDLAQGFSIYHFTIDSTIKKILFYLDNKKNENLSLICNEAFRINVNLTKQPFSITSQSFKYNFNHYSIIDKNYFLLGKKGNLFLFDLFFNFVKEYITNGEFVGDYLDICKWKNYYILLADDKMLHVAELNEKSNKIVDLFRIPIGKDLSNCINLNVKSNILIVGCQDRNVYKINIDEEFELFWNRNKLKEEEKESVVYNNWLKTKGSKKTKKGPVKKGASRGASANKSGKRPESAASVKSSNVKKEKENLPSIKEEKGKKPTGSKTTRPSKSVQPKKKINK